MTDGVSLPAGPGDLAVEENQLERKFAVKRTCLFAGGDPVLQERRDVFVREQG